MDQYVVVIPQQMQNAVKDIEGFKVELGGTRNWPIYHQSVRDRTINSVTQHYTDKRQDVLILGTITKYITLYSNYVSTRPQDYFIDIWKNGEKVKTIPLYKKEEEREMDILDFINDEDEEEVKYSTYTMSTMLYMVQDEVKNLIKELYQKRKEKKESGETESKEESSSSQEGKISITSDIDF